MKKLVLSLFDKVDAASLAYFRIAFGLLLFIELMRYQLDDRVRIQWITPEYNFTTWPFDFLRSLEGDGMLYLFYALTLLTVLISLGLFYRLSIILFFIGFFYVSFLDQTYYLNHFYLISMIAFVMSFLPMHRIWSLDKYFGFVRGDHLVSSWSVWLIRFTIALPYFFGGVAKINPDWLRGEPMSGWIRVHENLPILGSFLKLSGAGIFMSYASILLDLFIVPLLLSKKYRYKACLFIASFHLLNSIIFRIGVFPWLMLAVIPIFFEPEWIRTIWNKKSTIPTPVFNQNQIFSTKQSLILGSLFIFLLYNVLMPLRHLAIPGNVQWTEEGSMFSWHMMLNNKHGVGKFYVMLKKTKDKRDLPIRNYLTLRQERVMFSKPDYIWQFAQIVKKRYAANNADVAVFADLKVSLNGREHQPVCDPNLDLTSVPRPGKGVSWINKLKD